MTQFILKTHTLKVANSVFFPYFFCEVFEKKITKPFECVASYFQISQHYKISQKTNDVVKRETQKNLYI
jgi:hypothetical protein